MKTLSISSVWSALPFTILRFLILLLLPSFSLWSSESLVGGRTGVFGIVGAHAAAYDLLPGDPAFIYDEGWTVPPEWNTTGNADAANGYNLTNITRIGTTNSGFHLTFQGIITFIFFHLSFSRLALDFLSLSLLVFRLSAIFVITSAPNKLVKNPLTFNTNVN